jgi:replication factor C subunit 3/5
MFAKWMQMQTVLSYVARRAYFDLPPEAAQEIIKDSGGNLRKAILVLEALKMQSCVVSPLFSELIDSLFLLRIRCSSPDLSGPLTIAKPDWETYCQKVAVLIVTEQTPARVMEIRAKFYELLSHCIPPTVILKVRSSPCMQLPLVMN